MSILRKTWFAILVTGLALAAWAVTVGPLGPWQKHPVTSLRWQSTSGTGEEQAAWSPAFSLSGAPARLRVGAVLPHDAAAGTQWAAASLTWKLTSRGTTQPEASGDVSFTASGPYHASRETALSDDGGGRPRGSFRLHTDLMATAGTVVTLTISEERGYVAGFPVFWLIVFGGTAYVAVTEALSLRGRRARRVIMDAHHEHY